MEFPHFSHEKTVDMKLRAKRSLNISKNQSSTDFTSMRKLESDKLESVKPSGQAKFL